jgi:hypothetical protein
VAIGGFVSAPVSVFNSGKPQRLVAREENDVPLAMEEKLLEREKKRSTPGRNGFEQKDARNDCSQNLD